MVRKKGYIEWSIQVQTPEQNEPNGGIDPDKPVVDNTLTLHARYNNTYKYM